jgi:hypothetical protein
VIRRTLIPAAIYFGVAIAAGFALGAVRTLLVVPLVGTRIAELAETPVMLAVVYFAARWITLRYALPYVAAQRLAIGLIALVLMLLTEFTLVLRVRGMSVEGYFADFDPVAGTAYWVALGLFAAMPSLVMRR